MNFSIRELAPRDIFKFQSGFVRALEALSPVQGCDTRMVEAFLDRKKSGVRTYVAIGVNGEVIGTASLLLEKKYSYLCEPVGHIEDVAVQTCEQGGGVGSALVNYCIDVARREGCRKVVLECGYELEEFYRRLGFNTRGAAMRLDLVP